MTDGQIFGESNQSNESVIPPPPSGAPAPIGKTSTASGISSETVAIVSSLVALVGSFLPWARVFFVTINGTDGDGILTAILSSIALFLIYSSRRAIARQKTGQKQLGIAILSLAITAVIYIYDFANLTSLSDENSNDFIEISVQPQIGIIIGSIGAVVATISCLMVWKKRRNPNPVGAAQF